ncbi:periplasmic Fe-hydrogenase [Fusibacter sp. 3D3]|nr:periplasmic Fe-hydrogenase [Fusibacter sp. 3D3]
MHCSQGALTIQLDLEKVQNAIKAQKKVLVSLAPSFAGVFKMKTPGQMATALKQLGFEIVEETARGAEIISLEYEKNIGHGGTDNIITSCCPSSNYLIEHYYEKATQSVIPVVSPMTAHGLDMKSRYGHDHMIVFIGPCLAKKAEAVDHPESIDAVITFKELDRWFSEENIILSELETMSFDTPVSRRGRAYPLGGSLWKRDLKTRINPAYKYIHVDGIEACKSFLNSVENGEIKGYCAELNICSGSCINGPDVPSDAPSLYKRMNLLTEYVEKTPLLPTDKPYVDDRLTSAELHNEFIPKLVNAIAINDHQVSEILVKMGKYTMKDQLNCGACGYSSCYEKAVAITKGYSDIDMCLDTLRKKAESLQAIIFDNSPNAICILDSERRIQEVNPSFNQLFNATKIKLTYWPIAALIDDTLFEEIAASNHHHMSKKIYLSSVDRTFYSNVVKIQNGKIYVGIFTDITEAESNRAELEKVKEETLVTCQQVIEKQMRVAQEIASLLGETTAETKIGLNKLKKLVLTEGGD